MSEKPTYEELEQRIQELEQAGPERKRAEEALRQSKERYQGVVEDQTEIISRFYPDNTHTFVNDVYCRFFGKLKEELIGKKWFPNVYPDDVEMIKAKLMTMSPSNPVIIIENRVFSGKGDLHWMQFVNRGFYDHTGNLLEIQAVGRDITELKQADEALRKSEEKYRRLTENAKDMIYRMSLPDGLYEYVSPASIDLFGYTPEEFYESPMLIQKVIHPDWMDYFKEQWENLISGSLSPFYEYKIIHKTGEERWINQRNVLILNDNGQPKAIEGIATDITERKRAEERNERLGHILDESLNEIYIFDAKTFRFLQVNRGARHNLGYSIEEITTLTPLDLKPEFTPETFAELIQPLHNGEKNKVRFETIHRRKDGSLYPVEVHLQLVAGGAPVFVAIIIDITDRKQAMKALLKSEQRYRSFFKNNHAIMLLIDPENADIVDANPAAISYYGWSHEDLTGKKITDINILTKEKVFQEMERAKKEQQHFYFRHRLSNGEIRDVEVYSSPITIYNKNFLFSIIYDTTDRKLAESALIESERELKIKAKDLEELNAALKVLLNKRQEDKEELEEGILSNVRTLIEPYIVKLKRSKLPQSQKTLLNILESNLNEIVSPFTRKLSSKYLNLTPTQIQVANLVKQGKTNKDISEILHVAGRTIAFHRENIRKKLNLTNKKTNLKTYLMSID